MGWGVLTHAAGHRDPATELADVVGLAVLAEELGFDAFWVAQHHLGAQHGHAASPLVVLAAVAARTSRIRLGTAVVVAPLEDPLRLAEDAATVEALSRGRLELGLGAGSDPGAAEAFGRDHARRHVALGAVVDALLSARVSPPLPDLRRRTWIGTSSEAGVRLAAERGLGLLSGRRTCPTGPDDVAAAGRIATFRAAGGRRVGVSRPILPVPVDVAGAHLGAASPRAYTGAAPEVAAALRADPCVPSATHLLCHVQPARLTLAQLTPVLHGLASVRRAFEDTRRDHRPVRR